MAYTPQPAPINLDPTVARWIYEELLRLSGELTTGVDAILLPLQNVEPDKPREGMVVLADGTNWDPGSGRGFYGYTYGS